MRKKGIRGVFSIEAAYVMPVTAAVILSCLYCCMIWHDKAVLEAAAWRYAMKGARWTVENQSADDGCLDWKLFREKGLLWRIAGNPVSEEEIVRSARRAVDGKLLVCGNVGWNVRASWHESAVEYRAEAGDGSIFPGITAGSVPVSGAAARKVTEPEEWVRMARGILFRGEKEEGGD